MFKMKQKIVIRVQLCSEKCKTKALQIAAGAKGVSKLSIDVEKGQVEVIGDGVDAANLANSLRKKLGFAKIISVAEVKNPEEKPEKKAEETPADPPTPILIPYTPYPQFPIICCKYDGVYRW